MRVAVLVAGAGGVLLLAWSVRAAGVAEVLDGVSRVRWWFALVCGLAGVRYFLRAVAWRICLDDPDRLPLGAAFAAAVMGDALGNVTPFGVLVSEPSKVALVRRRVGADAAISAVTIENLFYITSVIVVLVCGASALLLSFDVGLVLRRTAYLTLGVALGFALVIIIVLMRRVRIASMLVAVLESWALLPSAIGSRRANVMAIEGQVLGFTSRHPGRVPSLFALEAGYHIAGVMEIWLTVTLIAGGPIGFVTAFVLEVVNRAITIAFQFVPMWLGVDEAGTGALTIALQLGGAAGVGLALVRKARVVVWTALGLALFFMSRSWARTSGVHQP